MKVDCNPYSDIVLLITGLNSINGKSSLADWKVRQYHKCIFFSLFFFPPSVSVMDLFLLSGWPCTKKSGVNQLVSWDINMKGTRERE